MEGVNIIERAFQLASTLGSVDEIRQALKREGYLNVDAHLEGPSIRSDLKSRLDPRKVAARTAGRSPGAAPPEDVPRRGAPQGKDA